MTIRFETHSEMLATAIKALSARDFWTPFSEVPSGKIYGEAAKSDGLAAFDALIGQRFHLTDHPAETHIGAEASPWGLKLDLTYPAATVEALIDASAAAQDALAAAPITTRVAVCLEALVRLNKLSFQMGHATMHTTGQAFPMAFQAGGPHAQDRGLEAVAMAYCEMTRFAEAAVWTKPQGKHDPIVMEKHWTIQPRGIALTIGCNTFPTWNSYPGIFASLATGNPVIIKPHPKAILPLALTVRVLREVLAEAGLPRDAVLLAVDTPGAEKTKQLVTHPDVAIIDYTGSSNFADWIRQNTSRKRVFTEETGVNSVVITGTDDFDGMCANLAFSLSLYSGQMCTSPQNIYIPEVGIDTDMGRKSFDDVTSGIVQAIDALLQDPQTAAGICGALANPATRDRMSSVAHESIVLRQSTSPATNVVTPLILKGRKDGPQDAECFGPVSFVIPCTSAEDAIAQAANIARTEGAITAALYATDDKLIALAGQAFARAAVNLSINLTGKIYVNQSAAFSDFHVTGGNASGNASLTDPAFIAGRFTRPMRRWPKRC
ncbi:phenylacetic acid degradation protein PaaN [Sagittula sp. NFXS13]|uniref:phenylacetic acid degradation protein PaaN n=1 Tax=Sagittula sp. NFXS13 TaxID=2819095 RepID=UPI0032DFB6AF